MIAMGSTASFGHGDHDWIRKGGYKSPIWGVDCCDANDCHTIDSRSVRIIPGGYQIGYQTYRDNEILPSEDGLYWGCGDPYVGYRCLFVPLGM